MIDLYNAMLAGGKPDQVEPSSVGKCPLLGQFPTQFDRVSLSQTEYDGNKVDGALPARLRAGIPPFTGRSRKVPVGDRVPVVPNGLYRRSDEAPVPHGAINL